MKYILKKAFFSFILIVLIESKYSNIANAQTTVRTDQAIVQMIIERNSTKPGETVWIGFEFILEDGWHTYWKNPGDSGLPIKIDWFLPNEIKSGPINWPTPERQPYGELMNYGYSNKVTILSKLSINKDAKLQNYNISANLEWLVCKEICIPQQGKFKTSLNITNNQEIIMSEINFNVENLLSSLPQSAPGDLKAIIDNRGLVISTDWKIEPSQKALFFPEKNDLINHSAEQETIIKKNGFEIVVSELANINNIRKLSGIIKIKNNFSNNSFFFNDLDILIEGQKTFNSEGSILGLSFFWAITFAFLGGLLLNLMPCVLPVLSLKVLAIVRDKENHEAKFDALFYSLGIMVSFFIMSLILELLRASGQSIGWGFQLQSPFFVTLMCYLMLAVGLSLSGVFNIGTSFTNLGSSLKLDNKGLGSFLTGILAVTVATPCTAPFMAPAIGYALTQSSLVSLLIFQSLALGFATPFLLIGLFPILSGMLPKPGKWMDILKQTLAFPMYAASGWMVWVASQLTNSKEFAASITGLVLLSAGLWIIGLKTQQTNYSTFRKSIAISLIITAIAIAGLSEKQLFNLDSEKTALLQSKKFSNEHLQQLLETNTPVFINFTASWCITCIINEQNVLSSEKVIKIFEEIIFC